MHPLVEVIMQRLRIPFNQIPTVTIDPSAHLKKETWFKREINTPHRFHRVVVIGAQGISFTNSPKKL